MSLCIHQYHVQTANSHTLLIVSLVHSYRKIPGDKCEGGKMPERKEIDLSKNCVSDLVGPELLVSASAYFPIHAVCLSAVYGICSFVS